MNTHGRLILPHTLTGTKPADDKHVYYACRPPCTYRHTHCNLIRSDAGSGLSFSLAKLNCTYELECTASSCCMFGCSSTDWFHFIIYLSNTFTFYISVIKQTNSSTGSPWSHGVQNQRLCNFIKKPRSRLKAITVSGATFSGNQCHSDFVQSVVGAHVWP